MEVLGHAGVEQTLTVLHQHFHWNGIKHDITLYVKCCDSCQTSKLVHHDISTSLITSSQVSRNSAVYSVF
jgi:hypothetical protein